jgi:hypothetical protein
MTMPADDIPDARDGDHQGLSSGKQDRHVNNGRTTRGLRASGRARTMIIIPL